MHRNIHTLTKTIQKYLERNSLNIDDPGWEIRKSELGGFGVFARRNIEVGEVIFKDFPVILGPRAALKCPLTCVNCYNTKSLTFCGKCGLQVCSVKCQSSPQHQKECHLIQKWKSVDIPEENLEKLGKVLSPIRSLLLSDEDKEVVKMLKAHKSNQHGFEVDIMKNILHLKINKDEETFMRFVCSVLDANAFEVLVGTEENQSSVKGLYPLGSLANHSCAPNTIHVFDHNQNMVVRASVFIPKNAEIFHSYSRCIWGTPTRRFHLFRTKHFLCRCPRCEDPTEFGSYMSAILCKVCKTGRVIQMVVNKWQCEGCRQTVDKKEVSSLSSLLGSTLNSFDDNDIEIMLKFVQKKLPTIVPESNETVIEMKYKLIWVLGHSLNATWTELSDDLLFIKEKFCKDLLSLLETLNLGQCKMRGLLLYELYCCYNEVNRRQTTVSKNHKNLLLEAADILMYDVTAPPEIKKLWSDEISLSEP